MYGFMPQQPQMIGRVVQASNYNEVQSMPIPADGMITLFMIANEPTMYMVSLVNGQKNIQGYRFEPLPTAQEATENRLARLENMLATLIGGKQNESNTQPVQPAEQSAEQPTQSS